MITKLLTVAMCAAALTLAATAQPHLVVKRQSIQGRLDGRLPTSASASAIASSQTVGGGSAPAVDRPIVEPPSVSASAGPVRRPRPRPVAPVEAPPAQTPAPQDETDVDELEPPRATANRRPGPKRKPRPSSPAYDSDANDEDCDEDDGLYAHDYGNPFGMAMSSMRHMGDMMGNIFDQMHGMASGDYADYPGNFAVSSSSGDTDGYSRTSSIVRNNGRTRGLISETRNGRTRTRRIGNAAGGDEDDVDE